MKIVDSAADMARMCLQIRRSGRTIGLVPTMGFLHEGHLSLIRLAGQKTEVVVVSIFVNPIQFGPGEDYERYPRNMARDTALCTGEGVDMLFCPGAGDMYDAGHSVYIEERDLSCRLCGLSRPGHFRGVLTVVAKLFNIVQPDIAVFGQKDAQQCRLVQKMVRDLNFQAEVIVGATVREEDGLAMSSRNVYLSAEERRSAVCIPLALDLARNLHLSGLRDAVEIKSRMRALVEQNPFAKIDYIEILDCRSWKPVDVLRGPAIVALAARIGKVRLIDNTTIGDDVAPPGSLPRPLPQ